MALPIGSKAPDFRLKAQSGEFVQLSERLGRGPQVLAFFPMAFTGVCAAELCEFQEGLAGFADLGADVYGISGDSQYTLKAFAEKIGVEFPLLSDYNHEVAPAYDVMYEDFNSFRGVPKRSVFVLDAQGVIRYVWATDNAGERPDLAAVREALQGLGGAT